MPREVLSPNIQKVSVNFVEGWLKVYTASRNHLRIVFEEMSSWIDTYNNVSRDEVNILDQIYIKQICPDFYNDDF